MARNAHAFTLALVCVATVAMAGAGSKPDSAQARCVPTWHAVVTASVPNLTAVAALSPTDVWAVGYRGGVAARAGRGFETVRRSRSRLLRWHRG